MTPLSRGTRWAGVATGWLIALTAAVLIGCARGAPELPATPVSVVAAALSATQVRVTWAQAGGPADGFIIGRLVEGADSSPSELARVPGTESSYLDGVAAAASYWPPQLGEGVTARYFIQAFTAQYTTPPSAAAEATTPSLPPIVTRFDAADDRAASAQIVELSVAASDDTGITGWFVSEAEAPPHLQDAGWSLAPPQQHVLSAVSGSKTLRLWVKDSAGNLSEPGLLTLEFQRAGPPGLLWEQRGGTEGADRVAAVWADGAGSLYVAGQGHNLMSSHSQADGLIVKLEAATGRAVWQRSFGGEYPETGADGTFDIVGGSSNKVYAIGYLRSTRDYPGEPTWWVAALDQITGRERWIATLGPGSGRFGAVDADGNLFVAGTTHNGWVEATAFGVLRLNPDTGATIWAQTFPGRAVIAGLALDASGNVVLVATLHQEGGSRVSVIKLDATSGTQIWEMTLDASVTNRAIAAVAGLHADSLFIAGARGTGSPDDPRVMVLSKLQTANGTVEWHRPYRTGDSGRATALAIDPAGNVIVGGTISGADEPGATSWIKKLSPDSGEWWELAGVVGGESINSLTVDREGVLYAAGSAHSAVSPTSGLDWVLSAHRPDPEGGAAPAGVEPRVLDPPGN